MFVVGERMFAVQRKVGELGNVPVCVCVREREREIERVFLYIKDWLSFERFGGCSGSVHVRQDISSHDVSSDVPALLFEDVSSLRLHSSYLRQRSRDVRHISTQRIVAEDSTQFIVFWHRGKQSKQKKRKRERRIFRF